MKSNVIARPSVQLRAQMFPAGRRKLAGGTPALPGILANALRDSAAVSTKLVCIRKELSLP